MRSLFVLAVTAGLLAACADEPRVVDSRPPGISYRIDGSNSAAAAAKAERYCARYGLRSQFQNVTKQGADTFGVYQCS
jgi:hypothetical protein